MCHAPQYSLHLCSAHCCLQAHLATDDCNDAEASDVSDVTSYLHWALLDYGLACAGTSRTIPGILLLKPIYVTFFAPACVYGLQNYTSLLMRGHLLTETLSQMFDITAGTYSNLVKQAKSKQKILDKMEDAGLTPAVQHESTFHFKFPDCDKLPPPVLPFQDVSFAYSGKDKDCLYRVCTASLLNNLRAVHTALTHLRALA